MSPDKSLYIVLGAVIHDHRVKRGLILKDLIACTGLTVKTLSAIETGRSGIQLHTLCQLADLFEIPAGELLDEARLTLLAGPDAYAAT